MAVDASKLLNEALSLPPEARAALAATLIESLDESVDPDAEAEWAKEITRRLEDLDTGRVQTIPWAEVRRSILRP